MIGTTARIRVVVAGDVTVDWNIADTSPASATGTWSGEQSASISLQPGGACMLATLARATLDADVRAVPAGSAPRPDDRRFHHSTAGWARFAAVDGLHQSAWRVNDYLGLSRRDESLPTVDPWSLVEDDPGNADMVILDDGGLGFADHPPSWPRSIRDPATNGRPVVVLKTEDPLARSALLQHLLGLDLRRLIVVITATNVRRCGIEVSRGLSWEASAADLSNAFSSNNALTPLAEAADVVVSFGAAGAFIARRRALGEPLQSLLVFDPKEMEGTWEAVRPGGMIGTTTSMTVGVATAVASKPTDTDLVDGVSRGLMAVRSLHQTGFLPMAPGGLALGFPTEAVAEAIADQSGSFSVDAVPPPETRPQMWSILRDRHSSNFKDLAHRIVRLGPELALAGTPLGQFGSLLTADRHEVEEFRSIRNLISEYCAVPRPRRPLSIAVFGPPGSGKSFAVTQVARSLHAGDVERITFNLSQMERRDDLTIAFHRVRDVGLSSQIPLVFWDEFDTTLQTQQLGWLRHFLAPMQDGEYQEDQLNHPIGRAIFVFAGGTAERLDDLGRDLGHSTEERAANFRSVKGPDFLSRLKGTVEILGPDPRTDDPAADPEHVVRRAIVLHSLLIRTWPQLLRAGPDGLLEVAIDDAVAAAFLGVRRYRHGVRSMESIISGSRMGGELHYHRSVLPPHGQLRLQVDEEEFLSLVRGPRRGPSA